VPAAEIVPLDTNGSIASCPGSHQSLLFVANAENRLLTVRMKAQTVTRKKITDLRRAAAVIPEVGRRGRNRRHDRQVEVHIESSTLITMLLPSQKQAALRQTNLTRLDQGIVKAVYGEVDHLASKLSDMFRNRGRKAERRR